MELIELWTPWLALDVLIGIAIAYGIKILISNFRFSHVGDVKSSITMLENDFVKEAEGDDARKAYYTRTTEVFYNLVTDFYEFGWGQSFHFAPRYKGEGFDASIVRYEHYVAANLGLPSPYNALPDDPPLRIADIGCGVGGPMRTVARFFKYKVRVTGVNITAEQIRRAQRYNARKGVQNCDFIRSDFNNIPVPDNTFDGIYEFEATVHSTDLLTTFRELYRVLKPGGRIVTAQYCLTGDYDPNNKQHLDIIRRLDNYNGFYSAGRTTEFTTKVLQQAGFKVLSVEDVFAKEAHNSMRFEDIFAAVKIWGTAPLLMLGQVAFKTGEFLRILPKGSAHVQSMMVGAATAYKEAGWANIFTPGMVFVLEKPLA